MTTTESSLVDSSLRQAWNQKKIPVALRRGGNGQLLRLRIPFSAENRTWLRNGSRTDAIWLKQLKCWELSDVIGDIGAHVAQGVSRERAIPSGAADSCMGKGQDARLRLRPRKQTHREKGNAGDKGKKRRAGAGGHGHSI